MNKTYTWFLAAALPLTTLAFNASAQESYSLQHKTQDQTSTLAETEEEPLHTETLSGIHLQPVTKGTFQLDFAQQLKEDAVLSITNVAGKKVFTKPVSIADKKFAWSYNVGKLLPGTYKVHVKTSDTTYWTSFKVGNPKSKAPAKKSKKRGKRS